MRCLLIFVVALTACGRTPVARCENCVTLDGGADAGQLQDAGVGLDAGSPTDAGVLLPCDERPAGPDCCINDQRVTSASCRGQHWVCERGSYCACGGLAQGFSCSDYCGSDILQPPSCQNGQWMCPRPLVQTNSCPPGTCWGEPGDNCIDPMCAAGRWSCAPSP